MSPYGTYMWTASSAGWFVLAYVTDVQEAWVTGMGCGVCAAIWYLVTRDWDGI